jgi:hypothetical protein
MDLVLKATVTLFTERIIIEKYNPGAGLETRTLKCELVRGKMIFLMRNSAIILKQN